MICNFFNLCLHVYAEILKECACLFRNETPLNLPILKLFFENGERNQSEENTFVTGWFRERVEWECEELLESGFGRKLPESLTALEIDEDFECRESLDRFRRLCGCCLNCFRSKDAIEVIFLNCLIHNCLRS